MSLWNIYFFFSYWAEMSVCLLHLLPRKPNHPSDTEHPVLYNEWYNTYVLVVLLLFFFFLVVFFFFWMQETLMRLKKTKVFCLLFFPFKQLYHVDTFSASRNRSYIKDKDWGKHGFTYKFYQCKWFCPCQMAILLLSQFVHTSRDAVKTSTHSLAENIFPFSISMRSIIIVGLILTVFSAIHAMHTSALKVSCIKSHMLCR